MAEVRSVVMSAVDVIRTLSFGGQSGWQPRPSYAGVGVAA